MDRHNFLLVDTGGMILTKHKQSLLTTHLLSFYSIVSPFSMVLHNLTQTLQNYFCGLLRDYASLIIAEDV